MINGENTKTEYHIQDTLAEILVRLTEIEKNVSPKKRGKAEDITTSSELIQSYPSAMIWTNFSLCEALSGMNIKSTTGRCSAILNKLVEEEILESPARNNFRLRQIDINEAKAS